MSPDVLETWTIYHSPLDAPGLWVVRRFVCQRDTAEPVPDEHATTHESLEDARRAVPPGLHRFPRHPADDAPVVETWL